MNEQDRYELTKAALNHARGKLVDRTWNEGQAFDWLERTIRRMGQSDVEQFDTFVEFGYMMAGIPAIESVDELVAVGLTQEQAVEAHRQASDPDWDGTPDG